MCILFQSNRYLLLEEKKILSVLKIKKKVYEHVDLMCTWEIHREKRAAARGGLEFRIQASTPS